MSTCDTCKFWKDDADFPGTTNEHGKICDQGMPFHANEQTPPANGLSVGGDIKIYAIYTGPKFGCVHHEAKA